MPRARALKPEAFASVTLASVSLTAERTFFGLTTHADDRGRHRDNAAIIAGLLWPLRPEHTADDVEEDLQQLHSAGLICRYLGCDGKPYVHFFRWDEHQKNNRPSSSRVPCCPAHHMSASCPGCGRLGCRLDRWEPKAPRTRTSDRPGEPGKVAATARDLLGEYAAGCRARPSKRLLAHLGREVKALLDDGVSPERIRVGLDRFRARPTHPSALAGLVNEATIADADGVDQRRSA